MWLLILDVFVHSKELLKKKEGKKVNFQISLKLPNKLYMKSVSVEGLLCSLINDIY